MVTFEVTEQLTRHLNDTVVWLTTVSPSSRPAPRPVWFVFDGTSFLIFSQPTAAKVRHIAANPNVSLNFNSHPGGGDVLAMVGTAERIDLLPSQAPGYLEKYEQHYGPIGYTRDGFDEAFSVALQVTPARSWGF
jgi:PPOX class probable F420-dependent enzyme